MRSAILMATLVACSSDALPGPGVGGDALSVGGDYAGSGIASLVDIASLEVKRNAVAGVVGGDPALRLIGDRFFVLDRFGGDSVTVLDFQLALVTQASTGGGTNPQDVAVIGDVAFVAALDAPGILVIDLAAPQRGVERTIDLSALDPDGVPDCSSIVAAGGRLYVSCSLFDRSGFPWKPRGPGAVVELDPESGAYEVTELEHENPFGWLHLAGDTIYVSTVPDPFEDLQSGCLETVHLPDLEPGGCRVENSELGGYVAAVTGGDGALWAAVATSATTGSLVRSSGGPWSALDLGSGANPTAIARCSGGELVVADNALGNRGVRVFDAEGEERTSEPLDVGWPTVFTPANSLACR